MNEYDHITTEQFDQAVEDLALDMLPAEILSMPGVREIVQEELNNEALDLCLERHPAPKRWQIENAHSGVVLGTFEGATEDEALDAMARNAGYRDYAHAQEIAPAKEGEIIVTEQD